MPNSTESADFSNKTASGIGDDEKFPPAGPKAFSLPARRFQLRRIHGRPRSRQLCCFHHTASARDNSVTGKAPSTSRLSRWAPAGAARCRNAGRLRRSAPSHGPPARSTSCLPLLQRQALARNGGVVERNVEGREAFRLRHPHVAAPGSCAARRPRAWRCRQLVPPRYTQV